MGEGRTYREALRNVERVAKEWIAVAKELGREFPEAKGMLMYA